MLPFFRWEATFLLAAAVWCAVGRSFVGVGTKIFDIVQIPFFLGTKVQRLGCCGLWREEDTRFELSGQK